MDSLTMDKRRGVASWVDNLLGGPNRLAACLVMFATATFSGVTVVGVPLQLEAAGLSKVAIAAFFVVGAGIAVSYNVFLLPRVTRRGQPSTLRLTTLAVPVGTLLIWVAAQTWAGLYVGALLMLFVTTVPAQVIGSAAGDRENTERLILVLRQVLVAGYLAGLGIFALSAALALPPLAVAAGLATVSFGASWLHRFGPAPSAPTVELRRIGPVNQTRVALSAVGAMALVGLMKAVDTVRAIYFPLFAVGAGVSHQIIGALFVATAVTELFVLPLLRRVNVRLGPALTLAAVSVTGLVAFALILGSNAIGVLIASQLLYASFGAGFQGVGMVLLSRTAHSDPGRGAATYMAVIQVGTVLGAVLPLAISGYGPKVFLVAAGLCIVCIALGAVLARTAGYGPNPGPNPAIVREG